MNKKPAIFKFFSTSNFMFCLPKLEDFFSKLKNLENPFAGEIKKTAEKAWVNDQCNGGSHARIQ